MNFEVQLIENSTFTETKGTFLKHGVQQKAVQSTPTKPKKDESNKMDISDDDDIIEMPQVGSKRASPHISQEDTTDGKLKRIKIH